jgi:hypothetical protein
VQDDDGDGRLALLIKSNDRAELVALLTAIGNRILEAIRNLEPSQM